MRRFILIALMIGFLISLPRLADVFRDKSSEESPGKEQSETQISRLPEKPQQPYVEGASKLNVQLVDLRADPNSKPSAPQKPSKTDASPKISANPSADKGQIVKPQLATREASAPSHRIRVGKPAAAGRAAVGQWKRHRGERLASRRFHRKSVASVSHGMAYRGSPRTPYFLRNMNAFWPGF